MGTEFDPTNLNSGFNTDNSLNTDLTALQTALSRAMNLYGDSSFGDNQMRVSLDMNNNRVINHPAPVNATDLVRLGDLSSADSADALTTIITDAAGKYTSDNVEGALAENLTTAEAASTAVDKGAALIGNSSQNIATKATAKGINPVATRHLWMDDSTWTAKTGAAPGTYADNATAPAFGTFIIPTGGDGSAAWERSYSGRENVLHFGADKTAATESSLAFNEALAVNGSVFLPIGSYTIQAVTLASQYELIGENIILTQLLAADNSVDMFTVPAQATYPRLLNFSARANGKTDVSFFNQVDKSFYIAHALFSRLNIYADIKYGFRLAPIYGLWNECIIGLSGAPGTTHVAILAKDDSGSPAAGHTLNTNSTQNCTFYNGRSVANEGMINVVNGDVFTSINDTFEASQIRAFYSEGVREASFKGAWFEACGDTATLSGKVSALSAHGTQFNLDSCRFSNASGPTASVFSIDAASSARLRNVESVGGSAGLKLQGGGGNILEYVGKTEDSTPTGYNNVPSKFQEWFDVAGEANVAFTSGGGTVTVDSGVDTISYTLTGDVCHVQGFIRASAVASPTGALHMTGLPFTSASSAETSDWPGFAVPFDGMGVAVGAGVFGVVEPGTTAVHLYEQTTTGKVDTLAANMAALTVLYFSFSYKIA